VVRGTETLFRLVYCSTKQLGAAHITSRIDVTSEHGDTAAP
jgi:hypothetical protein